MITNNNADGRAYIAETSADFPKTNYSKVSLIFELRIFSQFQLFELKLHFCAVLHVFALFSAYRGYEARKSHL
jgi:hypothetical protein